MVRLCGNGKPEGGGRKRQSEAVKGRKTPGARSRPKGKAGVTGEPSLGAGPTPTGPRPRALLPSPPLGGPPLSLLLQGPQASVVSCGLYLRSDQSHLLPLLPGPWEVRRCLWVVARWEIGGWASRLRGPEGDKGYSAAHSPPRGQTCWNNWLDSSRGGGQGGWGCHRGPKRPPNPPTPDHPPSTAFQVGAGTDLKLGPPQSLGLVGDTGQASPGRCQQSPPLSPGSSPTEGTHWG